MGFLGALNVFPCLVNRQKVSQMNRSVELSLLQLLRAGFLQSYPGNAAPHQLCRAHSRSAVLVGSLPLSCPEPALAARMGSAVGTSAPSLTRGPRGRELGRRGWVHACGGTWDHSLSTGCRQTSPSCCPSGAWLPQFCLHSAQTSQVAVGWPLLPPPLVPQALICPVSQSYDI